MSRSANYEYDLVDCFARFAALRDEPAVNDNNPKPEYPGVNLFEDTIRMERYTSLE
jgi:hypothetical protein